MTKDDFAPGPEVPEEIKDLLSFADKEHFAGVVDEGKIPVRVYRAAVTKAFQRGKAIRMIGNPPMVMSTEPLPQDIFDVRAIEANDARCGEPLAAYWNKKEPTANDQS